mmetsp:Transcript_10524/g.32390  ORF Transcript_10524/g.32390 Transcript_10524/m.32390 type:complete len:236 (+) Transcript_10524:1589-2296(+)
MSTTVAQYASLVSWHLRAGPQVAAKDSPQLRPATCQPTLHRARVETTVSAGRGARERRPPTRCTVERHLSGRGGIQEPRTRAERHTQAGTEEPRQRVAQVSRGHRGGRRQAPPLSAAAGLLPVRRSRLLSGLGQMQPPRAHGDGEGRDGRASLLSLDSTPPSAATTARSDLRHVERARPQHTPCSGADSSHCAGLQRLRAALTAFQRAQQTARDAATETAGQTSVASPRTIARAA